MIEVNIKKIFEVRKRQQNIAKDHKGFREFQKQIATVFARTRTPNPVLQETWTVTTRPRCPKRLVWKI